METLADMLVCDSVQVDDEERTNQRPDFIQLSNQSPDREDVVLYPDQWEDRVSLAERCDCFLRGLLVLRLQVEL